MCSFIGKLLFNIHYNAITQDVGGTALLCAEDVYKYPRENGQIDDERLSYWIDCLMQSVARNIFYRFLAWAFQGCFRSAARQAILAHNIEKVGDVLDETTQQISWIAEQMFQSIQNIENVCAKGYALVHLREKLQKISEYLCKYVDHIAYPTELQVSDMDRLAKTLNLSPEKIPKIFGLSPQKLDEGVEDLTGIHVSDDNTDFKLLMRKILKLKPQTFNEFWNHAPLPLAKWILAKAPLALTRKMLQRAPGPFIQKMMPTRGFPAEEGKMSPFFVGKILEGGSEDLIIKMLSPAPPAFIGKILNGVSDRLRCEIVVMASLKWQQQILEEAPTDLPQKILPLISDPSKFRIWKDTSSVTLQNQIEEHASFRLRKRIQEERELPATIFDDVVGSGTSNFEGP